MEKIQIGGKDYSLNITWDNVLKQTKLDNNFIKFVSGTVARKMKDATDEEIEKATDKFYNMNVHLLMMSTIWLFLKRRWYGLKPFVFKSRLKKKISPQEFRDGYKKISELVKVEDREGKN